MPTPSKIQLFVMPATVLYSGHSASWLTYVGLDEQERAASYRTREDAVSYAAQHTLMRCIAASALGVRATQAAEIPVDRTCSLCASGELHGKPKIAGISFNMARTQGLVAGVFSPRAGLILGLDLEKMRGNYYAGFDNIALTGSEKTQLATYSQSSQNVLRLMLWTAKQAVLKATGHGLSVSPASVAVDIAGFPETAEPLDYATTAVLQLPDAPAQGFQLTWRVHEDYSLAIASPSPIEVELVQVAAPLEVKKAIEG